MNSTMFISGSHTGETIEFLERSRDGGRGNLGNSLPGWLPQGPVRDPPARSA
jgi:hypothetical protein